MLKEFPEKLVLGLYLIKLVSKGLSPEKARDIVLEKDYDPVREFQEKYGKRWRRILEIR